mmetsp:Transcript_2550/g.6889  ORF Transcript_2550/g.6889 Transcript_2550/m.6889 type:complete len:625 (+) Transcript_2550:346-2220(+)
MLELLLGVPHLVRLAPQVAHLPLQLVPLLHPVPDLQLENENVLGQGLLVPQGHLLVHLRRVPHEPLRLLHVLLDGLGLLRDVLHDVGLYEDLVVLHGLLLLEQPVEVVDDLARLLPAPQQDVAHAIVRVADLAEELAALRAEDLALRARRTADGLHQVLDLALPGGGARLLLFVRVLFHDVVLVPLNASANTLEDWFEASLEVQGRRFPGDIVPVDDRKEDVQEDQREEEQVWEEEDDGHERVCFIQGPEVKVADNVSKEEVDGSGDGPARPEVRAKGHIREHHKAEHRDGKHEHKPNDVGPRLPERLVELGEAHALPHKLQRPNADEEAVHRRQAVVEPRLAREVHAVVQEVVEVALQPLRQDTIHGQPHDVEDEADQGDRYRDRLEQVEDVEGDELDEGDDPAAVSREPLPVDLLPEVPVEVVGKLEDQYNVQYARKNSDNGLLVGVKKVTEVQQRQCEDLDVHPCHTTRGNRKLNERVREHVPVAVVERKVDRYGGGRLAGEVARVHQLQLLQEGPVVRVQQAHDAPPPPQAPVQLAPAKGPALVLQEELQAPVLVLPDGVLRRHEAGREPHRHHDLGAARDVAARGVGAAAREAHVHGVALGRAARVLEDPAPALRDADQ